MADITRVIEEAQAAGRDPSSTAAQTVSGIPGRVLGEAFADVSDREAEAWCQIVERTIGGEMIRNALTK